MRMPRLPLAARYAITVTRANTGAEGDVVTGALLGEDAIWMAREHRAFERW